MAKSSVIEQLDTAVQAMLQAPGTPLPKADAGLTALAHLASQLRGLPRESFKSNLRSELERRASRMATASEPVASVRAVAAPQLVFKDAAKAIEFYKQALGARETVRFEAGGSIPHAEIMIGESLIALSDEWPEGGRLSAESLGNSPVRILLEVGDVDAFAAKAVSGGMKMINSPKDQFYGRRDSNFVDPFGYSWNIYTVTEEMSVEEMRRRMGAHEPPPAADKPKVDPVPKGYRMVTPYLVAQDGPALVDFVKQAFGAEETFRTMGSAGGLHAEVRIGDSTLMMGGGIPGREFRSTPKTQALHLYVKNADAVYQQALAGGATSLDEVRDQEYGERSGSVKDPAGNFWYIATHQGGSYIPQGLHNVNPYLHPLRAEPLINFLKRAFDAQEIAKYASPDGVVHHAQIRVGDSMIEMGEAHGKYPKMETMFYLYVPAVDGAYRKAMMAGATSISEPADQPYGDRTAAVRDDFGNQWYLATHVRDVAH